MSIFHRLIKLIFSARHNPDDVALVADIVGTCQKCKKHTKARLVAYYDKTIIVRCNSCRTADQFVPDEVYWTDPQRFLPFRDDEDPGDTSTGSGRYTRGER